LSQRMIRTMLLLFRHAMPPKMQMMPHYRP
jgi:hypothetical protein